MSGEERGKKVCRKEEASIMICKRNAPKRENGGGIKSQLREIVRKD